MYIPGTVAVYPPTTRIGGRPGGDIRGYRFSRRPLRSESILIRQTSYGPNWKHQVMMSVPIQYRDDTNIKKTSNRTDRQATVVLVAFDRELRSSGVIKLKLAQRMNP